MSVMTIDHGPPEREAKHEHAYGIITLNDLSVFPRYEITGLITGFRGRPPVDENADDNPGAIGATARPGLARPRDITYNLTVIARTLLELRSAQAALGAGFSDGQLLMLMVLTPAGDYTGQQWQFYAKPQALSVAGESFDIHQEPAPWQIGYTLTLRMYDPRFYAGAAGGLAQETVTLAAGVAGTATNLGTAPTDPEIRVDGPLTNANVTLTNVTTGKALELFHVDVASGDKLIVDFAARRIRLQSNGNSMARTLKRTVSTWWDFGVDGLKPGANSIQITGASGSVLWRHAHWG